MLEEALNTIPIRQDVFSQIFLIGAVQSFFLAIVVLWRSQLSRQILRLLSFFLFAMGALILDLYLARSGMMRYVIWYNDITEWLVLCLGPCIYLISEALINKSKLAFSRLLRHFAIPLFYLVYQSLYILQPPEHKFNAYIGAFQEGLTSLSYVQHFDADPLLLKANFERILLISIIGYALAGLISFSRHKLKPKWKDITQAFDKYSFILWAFGCGIFNGVALFFLFLFTEEAESHIYAGLFLSAEVFLLSFLIMSESNVFTTAWVADKYDTSGMSHVSVASVFKKVVALMDEQQPYLTRRYSLSQMAATLQLPANHVSQAINTTTGQNFNDFINHYRVLGSMKLLRDDRSDHLTIEGIGQSVGFSSKSSFYSAFKKVNGLTPLAYKNGQNPS